jgi:hypothetical protein
MIRTSADGTVTGLWCHRCDQGWVKRVRINKTGEAVHLCEECDALWPSGVPVAVTGFVDFQTYVADFGLSSLRAELTLLD